MEPVDSTTYSSQKTSPQAATRPSTFSDVGIIMPPDASGEVRTMCPQCSLGRGKSHDTCLSVNVEKGVWHCWYCNWRGNLHSVYDPIQMPSRLAPLPQYNPDNSDRIHRIWRQSDAITAGDPVDRYLRQRSLGQSDIPTDLRHHPRLRYQDGISGPVAYYPAMLAAVRNHQGRLVNVHRTYLKHEGYKADVPSPKKLMPSPSRGATRGAAVQFDIPGESLAVTEGIETGLAVRLCAKLPTWATLGTSGMRTLIVPTMVRKIIICADHDRNGEGLKAAKALAKRMLVEQRIVKILTPEEPGTDWADTMEVGRA